MHPSGQARKTGHGAEFGRRSILGEGKQGRNLFKSVTNAHHHYSKRCRVNLNQRSIHEGAKFECTVAGCNRIFNAKRNRDHHSKNPDPKLHDPRRIRKPMICSKIW
jgi:hypothetical protein